MTQAQAIAAAAAQTSALPPASNMIFQELETYPLNSFIIDEAWIIILYPSAYTVEFAAATLTQKYAFARVSIIALQTAPENGEDFKNAFDAAGALDPVLQPYLYP